MYTRPLAESFALEVQGIQLKPDMDKKEIAFLHDLILKYKVVVFRKQNLTAKEQIATCKQFGDIEPHPLKKNTCPYPEMTIVSNINEEGEPIGYPGPSFPIWHSDLCYYKSLPKFSFLYAEKVPSQGGKTLFANTTLAYEDLDCELKTFLSNKNAVFGFSKNLCKRCREKGYDLIIDEEDRHQDTVHPVVRQHPLTNQLSIFVNWTHTDSICELTDEDSERLLNILYQHTTKDKYIYAHQYQKDDLVVWDNSATLHTGDGTIALDKPRIMRRVIVRY